MLERQVPQTSHDAYKQSHELAQAHRVKILEALGKVECATFEELSETTGLEKHKIGRRLSELMVDEKIYRTGIQRPTSTGRNAYAVALIGRGIPKVSEQVKVAAKKPKKEEPVKPNTIPVKAHRRTINKITYPANQSNLFQ